MVDRPVRLARLWRALLRPCVDDPAGFVIDERRVLRRLIFLSGEQPAAADKGFHGGAPESGDRVTVAVEPISYNGPRCGRVQPVEARAFVYIYKAELWPDP